MGNLKMRRWKGVYVGNRLLAKIDPFHPSTCSQSHHSASRTLETLLIHSLLSKVRNKIEIIVYDHGSAVKLCLKSLGKAKNRH